MHMYYLSLKKIYSTDNAITRANSQNISNNTGYRSPVTYSFIHVFIHSFMRTILIPELLYAAINYNELRTVHEYL